MVDLVRQLDDFGMNIDVFDPWVDPARVAEECRLVSMPTLPQVPAYDAIVLAVAHDNLVALGASKLRGLMRRDGVLFDLKSALPRQVSDLRL